MNKDSEILVIYIVIVEAELLMLVHLTREIWISALEANKVPTKILARYLKYANIFSFNLAMELPKNININKYAI